jgi:signal transduction histidine kinase
VPPNWRLVLGSACTKGWNKRCAATGTSHAGPIEYRMRGKDGAIQWVEASPRAVFDGAGNLIGWADVIRDIGQRKRLEEEARLEREARQAADNANLAKTQFLANMSHELRTPLNAIIGFAELIQEDNTGAAQDAGRIERSAKHLLQLINQVLDMGKVEAGMLEAIISPTDVPALLQDVLDTLGPAARANNNVVELHVGQDVGMMQTDARLLKQCLLNLGSNACKFTHNGVVHIEAVLESVGENRVMAFRVIDTGIGISQEAAQRLFQPFVQADPSTSRQFGGTGLGLVLTRRFAQLLGGDAWVDSKIGVGSTFTLTIRNQAGAKPVAEASIGIGAAA